MKNWICVKPLVLGILVLSSVAVAENPLPQDLIKEQVSEAIKLKKAYRSPNVVPSERTLHVIYWTPSDREPIAQFRERLTRVFFDIREFYRTEMVRMGFGDLTFKLAKEPDGLLRIHVVRGLATYSNYNVDSGSKIRNECLPVLEKAGIDADKETLVIFCNMSNWDPQKKVMSQNSPYYAAGGLRSGTAWQVDSALLDAKLLSDKQPIIQDGQYGEISVGKYNSIFVGGVCHELGHALGLPHNLEHPSERVTLGRSLMGSGNQTYGDDRRKESPGSFLTLADGLRLASHPLFKRDETGIDLPASAEINDIAVKVAPDARSFSVSGKVTGDPPVYAVVGYLDPKGGSDYDATTVTCIPNNSGAFSLECNAFKKDSPTALRIVACQANGGRINDMTFQLLFAVDANGLVDVSSYIVKSKLSKLAMAVKSDNVEIANKELAFIEQHASQDGSDRLLLDVARSLTGSIDFNSGPAPSLVEGPVCWLSDSIAKVSTVGWIGPLANRLPNDSVVLSINGQVFARGLYAHAPSSYTYDLGGKWRTLSGFAGIADGHSGTVIFVVLGDGKELWRSNKTNEESLLDFRVGINGIKEITFRVEDSGDGNASDWGIWTDVKVER